MIYYIKGCQLATSIIKVFISNELIECGVKFEL